MSTGGTYQLLANDGPQDVLLMATSLLNRRLRDIRRLRCKHPAISDPMPTIVDIERTHILFVSAHFKPFVAVGYEYTNIPPQSPIGYGHELIYSIPQYGDFFSDMVLNFQLTNLNATAGNFVRCADYLGTRLVQLCRFEVNNNFLDQYGPDESMMHYNFFVSEDKRVSWMRMVGQEVPTPAYLNQNPGVNQQREQKMIVNGNQTPQPSKALIDLWVPLLFWFNVDPRLAIPSVAIPYGQRFIHVTLATPEMLFAGDPALTGFIPPAITVANLYINNIFLNPDIHDIFIKRVGFQLIRVHLNQTTQINQPLDQIKLDSLKYPIEMLYVGCRPMVNNSSIEDWHRFSIVTDNLIAYPVVVPTGLPPPAPIYDLEVGFATWKTTAATLTNIGIQTKGVSLYDDANPVEFYNKYLPYILGNGHIRSPDQDTLYLITFQLYPGIMQPSGHINLSRTREFYIDYQSANVSSILICQLVVIAVAINFLLIGFGTAVLRYNI
jgi:hypothetical protein